MKKITLLLLATASISAEPIYIEYKNNTTIPVNVVVKYVPERQCPPDNFNLQPKESKKIKIGSTWGGACLITSVKISDPTNKFTPAEWRGAGSTMGPFNFTVQDNKLVVTKG